MKTVTIEFKFSRLKCTFVIALFVFSLVIIFYLLHKWLLYLAMLLWLIALFAMLLECFYAKKLKRIVLVETSHARKANLFYGEQWMNDVIICRYILIAGILYVECLVEKNIKIKAWLFKDNFINSDVRYQLIRFLLLNHGMVSK